MKMQSTSSMVLLDCVPTILSRVFTGDWRGAPPKKAEAQAADRLRQPTGVLEVREIVVPLEGAGGKLTSTISSPIQVHGVAKAPARRGPDIGEHNDEILQQLGFSAAEIGSLHASATVPNGKQRAA